mgnify:FL=1
MEKYNISQFTKGWFLGNFEPSLDATNNFEIAVKYYKFGDYEERHYHEIATEYTVIVKGKVLMNNELFEEGDIIVIQPGESTDFRSLDDTITTVIKTPSIKNDKYNV